MRSAVFALIAVLCVGTCASPGAVITIVGPLAERYPGNEFYAEEMARFPGPESIKLVPQLMGVDQVIELIRIGGSAPPYDILWGNNALIIEYAKNGWLMPLDDYIQRYWDVYDFGDIPQGIWDAVSYEGRIYAIPSIVNVMVFFYRADLFTKYGLEPPQTLYEYELLARLLEELEPNIAGTVLTYKPADPLSNDFHALLAAFGGKWFDESNFPAFNRAEGIKTAEFMKRMMEFMPRGVLSYGSDEGMVALQQGKAATAIHWLTRCAAMDNPDVSTVVGKIAYSVPPTGTVGGFPASKLPVDAFAIPAVVPCGNPDLVFRVIAEALDKESMIRAAEYGYPARSSVSSDPALIAQYRYWPTAKATIDAGAQAYPPVVPFIVYSDTVMSYLAQYLAGELSVVEVLDRAAAEVLRLERENGALPPG